MARIAIRSIARVVGLHHAASCRVRLKKIRGTKAKACVLRKAKKVVATAAVVRASRATTVVIVVARRVAMLRAESVRKARVLKVPVLLVPVLLVGVMDAATMIVVVHVRRVLKVVSVRQDVLTKAKSAPLISRVKTECVKIGRRVLSVHRRRSRGSSVNLEQASVLQPSVANVRQVIATVIGVNAANVLRVSVVMVNVR